MTNEHDTDAAASSESSNPEEGGSAVLAAEVEVTVAVTGDTAAEAPAEDTAVEAPAEDAEGAPAEDAFRFELPAFEGPLDLLLHLIEREELDITEVSLLAVTEQYLHHLRTQEHINLGALAEFIAIGARLLLLKSRALLPREVQPAVEAEEEGDDVRALIEALREYRRFKHAAEFFRDRDGNSMSFPREAEPPEVPLPTGLEAVTLNALVDLIREVVARIPEEAPVGEAPREPIRLRDRMTRLVGTLDRDGRTSFRKLIEGAASRTEVIVDFMAVLELIKQRYLEARQSESFGDIDLVKLANAEAPQWQMVEEDVPGE